MYCVAVENLSKKFVLRPKGADFFAPKNLNPGGQNGVRREPTKPPKAAEKKHHCPRGGQEGVDKLSHFRGGQSGVGMLILGSLLGVDMARVDMAGQWIY